MPARILVVEDNAANLELVRFLLSHHRYTVLLARDGPEGVATALREKPDLILCDLQMPGYDGYQVLRELCGKIDTVIVALTAFSMPNDRLNVLGAGFDGYMSKPIDPEKFVRDVEFYLPVDQRAQPLG
ncbi:MAG TPA: response regulator [Burkholderiaceae bacterium]|nr:response regulator [Burkholderiaceae bacterium]